MTLLASCVDVLDSSRAPDTHQSLVLTWYAEGDKLFADMLAAVAVARQSVRLETYIFEAAGIGLRMRESLAAAASRGVRVQVLVDGFGSSALPADFWEPLRAAGGEARVFNPLRLDRMGIRDHRKLLVCDDKVAFVGGYNIAPNYEGDGVQQGWRDVALRVAGSLAAALGATFDRMYEIAAFRRKSFARLRRAEEKRILKACGCEVILSGPGLGGSPLVRALRRDLAGAPSAQVMVAYFLPTRRLWRALTHAARRGAAVELMLPGKSDVALSKLATESLYRRARIRIPAPDAARQTVHHRRRGVRRLFESGPAQPAPELRDHAAAGGAGSGDGGAHRVCGLPTALSRGAERVMAATAFALDKPEAAFRPLCHGAPRSLGRNNPVAVAAGLTACGKPDLPQAGQLE